MHQIFKSTFFNFEFLRILSMSPFGGSDIAECLTAAGEIKDLDPLTWHKAWEKQAQKAEALALEAATHGDTASARRAYMRSSNYLRASAYMWHDHPTAPDPRCLSYAQRISTLFRAGAKLLPGRVLTFEIPFEDFSLPAYLYLPSSEHRLPNRKTPVLINAGGADSIQEELYYIHSIGPELGYALLTFEGPGQGVVLRKERKTMRPDFETVTSAVLDHLSTDLIKQHEDLELDLDHIAISGASMGGYYALRSAADPRIKACVAIDPFFDMWEFATHHVSPLLINAWENGWVTSGFMNGLLGLGARFNFQLKWELSLTQWIFGVSTPADALLAMKGYTLKNGYLGKVHCPVLVSSASQSLYLEPSVDAKKIFDGLAHLEKHERRMWTAKEAEDGGLQAKVGAFGLSAQRTFQYLDECFEIERPGLNGVL